MGNGGFITANFARAFPMYFFSVNQFAATGAENASTKDITLS
jgi:hypothetical protein